MFKKYIVVFFVLFILPITLAGCQSHGKGSTYYTCPMHTEVEQEDPGLCPVCGMDLEAVPVK